MRMYDISMAILKFIKNTAREKDREHYALEALFVHRHFNEGVVDKEQAIIMCEAIMLDIIEDLFYDYWEEKFWKSDEYSHDMCGGLLEEDEFYKVMRYFKWREENIPRWRTEYG